MKRFIKPLVTSVIFCSFLISSPNSLTGERYQDDYIVLEKPTDPIIQIQQKKFNEIENSSEVDEIVENIVEDGVTRPLIDNIPLDDELLDYIYNLSEENEIAYTYLLAIMKVESDYDHTVLSRTNDMGLFQINKSNIKSFSKMAGISDPDPYNPYHNVAMAVAYISYLNEYWSQFDYSEEDKFYLVTLSYNRGIAGAKRYIQKHGWNNSYVNKVLKVKEEIEERHGDGEYV